MNDAQRYRAEFDQLMRDVQAQADSAQNRDREIIWRAMEKSFNQLAEANNWSPEKRAASKKYLLEHAWD
jgi:hypothetical protein